MNKRANAGYEIIETISLPDEEYVLGERTTTFTSELKMNLNGALICYLKN